MNLYLPWTTNTGKTPMSRNGTALNTAPKEKNE